MPQYRRSNAEGATYFFTVVTFQRARLLCLPGSIEIMRRAVSGVARSHPFTIDAWVTLPDHLHCLWTLPPGDSDFSIRWALIKRAFTQGITRADGVVGLSEPLRASRQRRREAAVWQRRFWEHQIRSDADFSAHMDYIHYRPVKHRLAGTPAEWPHSTFRPVRVGYVRQYRSGPPRGTGVARAGAGQMVG